jgi:hypothetical protein
MTADPIREPHRRCMKLSSRAIFFAPQIAVKTMTVCSTEKALSADDDRHHQPPNLTFVKESDGSVWHWTLSCQGDRS